MVRGKSKQLIEDNKQCNTPYSISALPVAMKVTKSAFVRLQKCPEEGYQSALKCYISALCYNSALFEVTRVP